MSTPEIQLRDIVGDDLSIFFEYQLDPVANHMAAFTAKDPADRAAFDERWARILADDTITKKAIAVDGQVVGNIVSFSHEGKPEVGYWIGKEYWGKGIATKALAEFLRIVSVRPLYAGAAKDNLASIRVLEKCGFAICSNSRGYSNARGAEIEEVLLILE